MYVVSSEATYPCLDVLMAVVGKGPLAMLAAGGERGIFLFLLFSTVIRFLSVSSISIFPLLRYPFYSYVLLSLGDDPQVIRFR